MPLTHTVLSVPVELVRRQTLALVAAHCVHAKLLAASIVDAALIGVCGAEQSPVTTSQAAALPWREPTAAPPTHTAGCWLP